MISSRADVSGLDRLRRKLGQLPAATRAEIRATMAAQADDVVAMMKRLAPQDSGALRKSIGWAWRGRAPKGSLALGTVGEGDLSITIFAGTRNKALGADDAFYAHFVEFGTEAHRAGGKFEGAQIPAIPAQPFFFPSWRAARKGVRRALAKASRDAARKVAASG